MKTPAKPDIFTYHDHIGFLRDWLQHLEKTKNDFSLRTLASKSNVATGYLPMVLANKRKLTEKGFLKLLPHLELDAQEKKFLSLLRLIGESSSSHTRIDAVNQMSHMKRFLDNNKKEIRVYEYLTKWFYVAIRELVALNDFKYDYEWIRNKLNGKLTLAEIEDALDFLIANGFLIKSSDGKLSQAETALDCREGIFKLSLGQFHRQMLGLAADSIESVPRDQRYIMGHTVAISESDFKKIKEIIDESVQKITQLGNEAKQKEHVYHIEIAAFPLTKNERK